MGAALSSVLGQREEETSCMTQRARQSQGGEGGRREHRIKVLHFGFHREKRLRQRGALAWESKIDCSSFKGAPLLPELPGVRAQRMGRHLLTALTRR